MPIAIGLHDTKSTMPQERVWDEHACIEGCKANERASQELFYKRFFPVMTAVVYRYTPDRDHALSIVNNAFMKAFNKMGTFRGDGSVEGWLRRIVIHSVTDYFRSSVAGRDVLMEDLPSENSCTVNISYDYKRLLELMNTLPAATRVVANLFLIDGYSHNEISKIVGISEGTSKWHVSEARKQLIKKLGEHE